ncbi:hypothetical protein ILYODFUR_032871, partial [Ilyodon furcidens]
QSALTCNEWDRVGHEGYTGPFLQIWGKDGHVCLLHLETSSFGQLSLPCGDVMLPSKDAAPEFGHSYRGGPSSVPSFFLPSAQLCSKASEVSVKEGGSNFDSPGHELTFILKAHVSA